MVSINEELKAAKAAKAAINVLLTTTPRACSGRIESQDSQRTVNGRVCLELIRLGAAHAEGIFCGYSHAGDRTR